MIIIEEDEIVVTRRESGMDRATDSAMKSAVNKWVDENGDYRIPNENRKLTIYLEFKGLVILSGWKYIYRFTAKLVDETDSLEDAPQ